MFVIKISSPMSLIIMEDRKDSSQFSEFFFKFTFVANFMNTFERMILLKKFEQIRIRSVRVLCLVRHTLCMENNWSCEIREN